MARLGSYINDTTIQDNDSFIGSSTPGRKTRNFLASDVAKYLTEKGKISISAQMTYKFESDSSGAGAGNFYGVASGTAYSAVTSLQIHSSDTSGQVVTSFLEYLVGSDILISEQNQISSFGHYKITSYAVDTASFYTLQLSYIGGNGTLTDQKHYDVANFVLDATSDKHFAHTQNSASATWSIAHDLEKFPSVTVVLSSGKKGYGDVNYTDKNNLTITFAGAESGKAYMN